MDLEILKDLGLTGAESKVFFASLELGLTQAGSIVQKSGLQNAVVHRTLHSLVEKGLMTYILKGKTKHYQVNDAKDLVTYIDRKKERLLSVLPELIARQQKNNKSQAQIYEGVKGIKEAFSSLLENKPKEFLQYGGTVRSIELLDKYFWISFNKKMIELKMDVKLLLHESLRDYSENMLSPKGFKTKFTKQSFEEITSTTICGDKVLIVVWSDIPFAFSINSVEVVNSYKKFFEMMWKLNS